MFNPLTLELREGSLLISIGILFGSLQKNTSHLLPLGVSVTMSSSDMEETSPVTGEENLVSSREIPLPSEGFPFHSGLGVTLLLHYCTLSDIMSSMSLNRSSVWSCAITPTSEPFIPQIHNVSVTSVPSMPTVCVASTTHAVSAIIVSLVVTFVTGPSVEPASSGPSSSVSRVINPTGSSPLSFGSILAGWSYEQYMFTLQNPNHNLLGSQPPSYPHNPLHY